MASCEYCGRLVSFTATVCPNCGHINPAEHLTAEPKSDLITSIGFLVGIAAGFAVLLYQDIGKWTLADAVLFGVLWAVGCAICYLIAKFIEAGRAR